MNVAQKIILTSLLSSLLCACQTVPQPDTNTYSLAVDKDSGMQRTKYVPVAMPGQLMSIKKRSSKKRLLGKEAITAANKKAIKQPNSSKYINSIMNFDYMTGALYEIYSAPLNVTDIQFQNNEHIIAVGAGDTLRWKISKTYSGIGANRQEHLLIKPTDEDLTNSLVVTTDLRTYHMLLHSTPETYMASVTWRYPDSDGLVTEFGDYTETISDVSDIDLNKMNFSYQAKLVQGAAPDWYPKMIFNDGRKTYIKFSAQSQDAPTLFVGSNKSPRIINYRVQGNYFVIDKVLHQAQLRGGLNNQTIVQITMKK